ncbi:MAG TPA: YhfC family intramembrane metalloprotease, partial [Methanocella sp.]|nr:YhfC family intramembrane metalloprotease [Methanocella sp.]
MVIWLNIVTNIGMIAVGVGAIVYWYVKKRSGMEYFLIGGVFWVLAIALKLAMNFTIASQFTSQAGMIFAPLITAVVIGL